MIYDSSTTRALIAAFPGEQAGRDAYDRGERWSIAKPEEWRRGWIAQQHKNAPTKFANERRELKAFEEAARNMREKGE